MTHRLTHSITRTVRTAAVVAIVAPLATLAFAGTAAASGHHGSSSTIYTETNDPTGNEVLAFRVVHGELTQVGTYPTGGLGADSGLGSQAALVADGDHLIAVNAGSDTVSLFDVARNGSLRLTDVESSGGDRPVSVDIHGNLAYVVNTGDETVSGFRIRHDRLVPIAGSTRSLPGEAAAQIAFDQSGRRLVVTQKNSNTIDVLAVDRRGAAGPAESNPSTGSTPFGFRVDRRNHVIVSNAAGGAAGASSVSSYRFDGRTGLVPISSAVANDQGAACWIELSANQRHAFSANTGSGTISSYRLRRDGSLSLHDAAAATPGAGPSDMIEADGTLYSLSRSPQTITAYSISRHGDLTEAGSITIPDGATGLAAD